MRFAFCLMGCLGFLSVAMATTPVQAKGQEARKFAVIAAGRGGAGVQTPTPQERSLNRRLVEVQTDWGVLGGLELGVLWRSGGKGWFKDLRATLDYESSMRLKMAELDLAGREVSKPLRWQRLSVGVSPRLSAAVGPGRLGIVPSLGYRLRTLFTTVPAAVVNHGRHGVFLAAGVGYGFADRFEIRLAPQADLLLADAALKRQAEGDLRVSVGGMAELAFWVKGPWRVSARWEQMHAVAGDTKFASQVASLALGFDPAGWTK